MSDFVHLHCHTEYSLLDGAIQIKDLCAKAVEFGMQSVAITDHGNLFGALDFYTTAKSFGLKPIIGCEVYVAPEHRSKKEGGSPSNAGYHLVLLAKDQEGYHNLIKLVSKGFLEGFYYKPRIDKELLQHYSGGLIGLSACLKGEIPSLLMRNQFDEARERLQDYESFFPGRFYLELQANGITEQEELNRKLLELAETSGHPLVATNDCHYLTAEDVQAHDILLCIQTNAKVQDSKRMRFNTNELYYRPPQEMEQAFAHCPQAVANTGIIAEACNLEIELGRHHFPVYEPKDGLSLEQSFRNLSEEGLRFRLDKLDYVEDEQVYWDRLRDELDIICDKGFAGYFLIVQDFINWAKKQGIPVGPGRGSAAGSLVAYALKITNLDPIRYNLLFERFLNVERESLPDIDVDFCYHRREEVIRYVTQKYGKESVSQITTFGTMKARAAIRDVGRSLGMSFAQTDTIAKLIPDELKMTIDKALEQEPELKKKCREDEQVAQLIDISKRLEGLCRHASTHAAGIVISDRPMQDYLPLYLGKKGEVVTQYDMKKVEKVGLIKFDFLGLKTLTVLSDALDMARKNQKEVPDLDTLPLDDPKTFALLCSGRTEGVFQLESSGMRDKLMDLQPNSFEDIIALLALYRPGPLESGMVSDFIRRKHGEITVEYPHPSLEPILKETYGVILYQEQVMRIASELAGYSLGDGDILRRAMGKKDAKVMDKQRSKFIEGCTRHEIPEDMAEYLFDLIEKFAGYGFNKSHSAAYALISYQTAYIKAHFPKEYMAALITSEVNDTDKVLNYLNACREMGLEVKPPDINTSLSPFNAQADHIRFGLAGIKNVGQGAIQEIVREREKNGPYASLLDLCQRINLRKASKRVLESLIKSGALDCFHCTRSAMTAALDKIVATAQKKKKAQNSGQLSLLSIMQKDNPQPAKTCGLGLDLPEAGIEEWPDEERLQFEKESLGCFISGHPLLRFSEEIKLLQLNTLQQCWEYPDETEVTVGLLVTASKEIVTKKGKKMAFCQVEDLTGTGELTIFPELYARIKPQLQLDQPLHCTAKVAADADGDKNQDNQKKVKLLAQKITPLAEVEIPADEPYCIDIQDQALGEKPLDQFKAILKRYPGKNPVQITLQLDQGWCRLQLGPDYCVLPVPELSREVNNWKQSLQHS